VACRSVFFPLLNNNHGNEHPGPALNAWACVHDRWFGPARGPLLLLARPARAFHRANGDGRERAGLNCWRGGLPPRIGRDAVYQEVRAGGFDHGPGVRAPYFEQADGSAARGFYGQPWCGGGTLGPLWKCSPGRGAGARPATPTSKSQPATRRVEGQLGPRPVGRFSVGQGMSPFVLFSMLPNVTLFAGSVMPLAYGIFREWPLFSSMDSIFNRGFFVRPAKQGLCVPENAAPRMTGWEGQAVDSGLRRDISSRPCPGVARRVLYQGRQVVE